MSYMHGWHPKARVAALWGLKDLTVPVRLMALSTGAMPAFPVSSILLWSQDGRKACKTHEVPAAEGPAVMSQYWDAACLMQK